MSQHTLTLLRFTYKKLKEKLTVSDSKKLFHEQFPFVIPGLYKRIVDEMLVELNLLNHYAHLQILMRNKLMKYLKNLKRISKIKPQKIF